MNPVRIAYMLEQTHRVVTATSVAHWVVSLSLDGRVVSQGPISDALKQDSVLFAEVKKDQEELELQEKVAVLDGEKERQERPSGKLMTKEEVALGHVSWLADRPSFQSLP
jgi:hypothetical protein